MKAVFLLIFLQTIQLIFSQSGGNQCRNIKKNTCWFCVQKPGCAWCSDELYVGERCDTPANHKQNNCPSNHTINPVSTKKFPDFKPVGSDNQLSPKKVNLTLRVGEPFSFKINVRPAKNYPVDLYYLMDLSKSMADDLDTLKSLAGNISKKLNELTNRHRLAFGSYVDKVILPYVKREDIGKNYCFTDPKGKKKCGDPPYDYKHILDFTPNAAAFKNKIGETTFSGNRDIPEGLFDALMQIAVCEKKLKWNPKGETRRMVLIATDAPFHFAGEGKYGGIVEPNDEKCYLGDDGKFMNYTKSLEMDYPSVNQVFRMLVENNIQPIFAVGNEAALSSYQALADSWSLLSATYGELGESSEKITDLIDESYRKIVSTVLLAPYAPDGVQLKITPNCGNKPSNLLNQCKGISPGDDISFDVSVTVDSCDKGNSTSFYIKAVGVGLQIDVNVNIICKCDCQSVQEKNSNRCSGNGTFVCGGCDCNPGWSGTKCLCDLSKGQSIGSDACKQTNTSNTICEGNGDCVCGECQCKLVGNKNKRYYGKYCQCSDYNCEQFDNQLCGGELRGKCECGKCKCFRGFIGSNCGKPDCSLKVGKCLKDGVNCSDKGDCDCGECICKPFYQGKYCEKCPSCAGKCDDFKVCVLCEVFGYVPENKTECESCPKVVKLNSLSEMQALGYPAECGYTDGDGCKYVFTYGTQKGMNVTTVYAVTEKECPEGPDVLLIVLAVIGGIVGIGILLLILWKLLTAMVDRREYEKFEKDRAKSKWHREKNPLYQPATSTVQNPTFVGAKT